MKRSLDSIVWALLAVLAAPLSVSATGEDLWDREQLQFPPLREVTLPDVDRIELSNGMILFLLADDEFPVVQGQMMVRVGSWCDPSDKVGLVEMTGTVLRAGGSQRFPGDDLDRRLEGIGASVEFGIGETNGTGSFWCLRENTSEVLAIFADLARHPAFPEEKCELAKVSLRREIAGRNDEPMDILFREMGKLIWGKGHPYARHPEYATVEAVTREDLAEFHQRFFHPDRIYLTIWGDFDKKKMRKEVEGLFGDWKRSGSPAPGLPAIAAIVPGGGLAYAEKTGTTNTWVVMGHVGLRADSPDYAAMNVLGEILGGGFSSRLFNEIRSKRGLAYAAGSISGADIPRPGVFIGYAGTRSDSSLVVLGLLRKEIRKVTEEPVTDEELKIAKDGILNSYVFQFASKGQIANRMAFLDFHGYPADFTARYPEEVKKLAAQDLLTAAKRNIHPDDLQVLLVGNEADFAKPLSSLGAKAERIDLTIPDPPGSTEIPPATPQSLAEGKRLLTRASDATGGAEGWRSVNELSIESEMSAEVQGMKLSISVHSIRTADGRDYVAQVLPFGEVVLVRSGDTGWKKSPRGIEDLTTEEIEELQEDRARDFWQIFAKIEGIQAQALKREKIGEKLADAIVLSGPNLDQVLLYLDTESGQPVAVRYRGTSPTSGAPVETTEMVGDYRPVGPVRLPHAVEILHDGELFAKGIVKRAAVNEGVDESMFARPQ